MARAAPTATVAPALARLRRGLDLRANSLLITVFGDAFAPRGQSIWLGSLIELLGLFGISSRLVRTSAFRLGADDWFVATRIGRRSYYGLSDAGVLRVQHADQRIYDFNTAQWDGHWTLVLLDPGMRASDRLKLQRELLWESFGRLSPLVFVQPHMHARVLAEIISAAGMAEQVAVLRAQGLPGVGERPLLPIMHAVFDLAKVARAWTQFVDRFSPVLRDAAQLEPAQAFMARTLLIHEYRRVVLRDPNLPKAFLPADWPGERARSLCEQLYGALLAPSERYLRVMVRTDTGALRATPSAMRRRSATRSKPPGRAAQDDA
ncbi:MAG: phenylacetic acid degradation operon negative regulatory protein PaaX [Burkholderiaceae bacterium]|nr:phenylacetic acid degradation operon negative regulatory protein PaaX [Rhodoferax sp.]MCP5264278.1 phenylacetic acid degradation operon negative regulatory protein PaaX [Rhodoferax sp.]